MLREQLSCVLNGVAYSICPHGVIFANGETPYTIRDGALVENQYLSFVPVSASSAALAWVVTLGLVTHPAQIKLASDEHRQLVEAAGVKPLTTEQLAFAARDLPWVQPPALAA